MVVSHDRRFLDRVAPTIGCRLAAILGQPLMAVPKRKTSKSRRDKRARSTASRRRASTSARSAGSRSGRTASARRARRTRAARSSRSARRLRSPWSAWRSTRWAATAPRTRSSRARSTPPPTAIEPCSSAPRGLDTGGLELVEAPDVIGCTRSRRTQCARSPDSSLVAAHAPSPRAGRRGRLGREHGRDARRRACSTPPAAGRPAARDRRPDPGQRGPSVLLDTGANADARPEHLLQFAHMGADLRRGDARARRARGAPALDRRGAREGQPADARGARAARRRASSASRGNTEGRDLLAAPPTSSSATASPATSR